MAHSQWRQAESRLKAKDYSVLEGLFDYDAYVQQQLDRQSKDDPKAQADKALREKVESLEKGQNDFISKQMEAATQERRTAVQQLVDSDPRFASIKETDNVEAVVQHILDTWEKDDLDLSPEQAALEVEEVLLEEAQKWAKLSKVQPKPVVEEKTLPPLKQVKTLTNQVVQDSTQRPPVPLYKLSAEQRFAEAQRRAQEEANAIFNRVGNR